MLDDDSDSSKQGVPQIEDGCRPAGFTTAHNLVSQKYSPVLRHSFEVDDITCLLVQLFLALSHQCDTIILYARLANCRLSVYLHCIACLAACTLV